MFEVGSCDMHVDYSSSQVHYRNNISIGVMRLARLCCWARLYSRENTKFYFRHLIRRRQGALLGGDRRLYNQHRNNVNLERRLLQRRYYERKIQALEKDHPKRWWNNIKYIAGVKVHCDSLQGLANSHCAGKLDVLADDVCDFLQSMTTDFTPLSPDDTFLPLGADTSVPDTYIISVAEVTDSLSRINTNKAASPDEIPN